jgi:hypothetical protein
VLSIPKVKEDSSGTIDPELLAGDSLTLAKQANLGDLLIDACRQFVAALKDWRVSGRLLNRYERNLSCHGRWLLLLQWSRRPSNFSVGQRVRDIQTT